MRCGAGAFGATGAVGGESTWRDARWCVLPAVHLLLFRAAFLMMCPAAACACHMFLYFARLIVVVYFLEETGGAGLPTWSMSGSSIVTERPRQPGVTPFSGPAMLRECGTCQTIPASSPSFRGNLNIVHMLLCHTRYTPASLI